MFGCKRREAIAPDVRFATGRDIERMLEIERMSFDCPWTRLDFMMTMRQAGVQAVTAELCDTVAAYAVIKKRGEYTEIWNLAVAPRLRRRGLGRLLVEKLRASVGRLGPLRADVSERNLTAQLFFRAMSFRAAKTIHGAWTGSDDGAYQFVWTAAGTAGKGNAMISKIVEAAETPEPPAKEKP